MSSTTLWDSARWQNLMLTVPDDKLLQLSSEKKLTCMQRGAKMLDVIKEFTVVKDLHQVTGGILTETREKFMTAFDHQFREANVYRDALLLTMGMKRVLSSIAGSDARPATEDLSQSFAQM